MLRSRAPSSGQGRSERAPVIARLSVAFLGGVLSFLSPCVLPLVPSYLAAIAAPAGGTHGHAATTKQALTDAAPFVVGFTSVFVLLGAGAGVIGGALPFDAAGVRASAGFILVVLGLALAGALPWGSGALRPACSSRRGAVAPQSCSERPSQPSLSPVWDRSWARRSSSVDRRRRSRRPRRHCLPIRSVSRFPSWPPSWRSPA